MSPPKNKQSFVISVLLKKGCYRHLRVPAGKTLEELAGAIIWAFDFDNDHAHAFFMDNKSWSSADCYYMAEVDEDEEYRHTCDYQLAGLGLQKGDTFKFLFDFGDSWEFKCKVLRIEGGAAEHIELIRTIGDAPEQYPPYEE